MKRYYKYYSEIEPKLWHFFETEYGWSIREIRIFKKRKEIVTDPIELCDLSVSEWDDDIIEIEKEEFMKVLSGEIDVAF